MVTDNHYRWDFIQLSTDPKPTPATSHKVADGSTLYTSDDSKLYIWYKTQWYEKKGIATDIIGVGRFLSGWDCTTGKPDTDPEDLPYEYNDGDYYIVSAIDTTTNYRPSGSTYDGTASITVETANVQVNDFYFYDGTQWLLLKNNTPTTTETLYFTLADDSVVSKTFYIKNS